MKFLSIIIPTYNRPEKIVNQVTNILPQLTDGTELIIIDNCSPVEVKSLIWKSLPQHADKITFVRNIANIGGNANITRCFELGNSEWIWLLGDDDIALPNAVELIINEIKERTTSSDNFAGFHFSSSLYQYGQSLEFDTLEKYCDYNLHADRFSNSLFISSCVYNTMIAREHLKFAYQSISSCGPHMALTLRAMSQGYKWGISSKKIIDWQPADPGDHWSFFPVANGLPLLAEVPECGKEVMKNLHGVLERAMWFPLLKGGVFMCLFSKNHTELYWVITFSKFRRLLAGKKKFKICLLYILALCCYHIYGFKLIAQKTFSLFDLNDCDDMTVAGLNRF